MFALAPTKKSGFCDVRDTSAFAVNSPAFPAVSTKLRSVLAHLTSERVLQMDAAEMERAFPWFDMWIPETFETVNFLPSLVVQQRKQSRVATSVDFRRECWARRRNTSHVRVSLGTSHPNPSLNRGKH